MPDINVFSQNLSLGGFGSCVHRKSSTAPGECVGESVSSMGWKRERERVKERRNERIYRVVRLAILMTLTIMSG